MYSDRELREAVNNINRFFNLDEPPYALTEFSISASWYDPIERNVKLGSVLDPRHFQDSKDRACGYST